VVGDYKLVGSRSCCGKTTYVTLTVKANMGHVDMVSAKGTTLGFLDCFKQMEEIRQLFICL
jgi:hypothetical protein